MNLENLNRAELFELYFAIEKKLGWYSIVTLCADDVKDYIEENGLEMPSDSEIHQACAYVSRKHDESSYPFIEWALEVIERRKGVQA